MHEWNRRAALRALGGAALGGSTLLAACGGNSEAVGGARVRLLNASNGYASLDLLLDDRRSNSGIGFGAVGGYADADTDGVDTEIRAAGSATALASATRTLGNDSAYTVVAYGWAGALKTALVEENLDSADSGKARLRVLNLAPDAGTLDVYLTGADEALDSATAVAAGVAGTDSAGPTTLTAAGYRLRVTAAGDRDDLRLDVTGLTLGSTQVATLLLLPGSGGVLVSAVLLLQKGAATVLANPKSRLRVVAAIAGNGRVSVAVGGAPVAAGAVSPAVGGYAQVDGGTRPLTLSVDGRAVAVADQALPAGGDYTLLVWGTAAAPQLTLVADDNRRPGDSAKAKIRLVHGVAGLDAALTLTADFGVVGSAASVAPGQASSYGTVTAGSAMRLEVASPLSSTPLYTLADTTLVAQGLYTVFMLGEAAAPSPALRKER